MKRESFASDKNFILCAVAASVGLGNVMRFPGLCAKFGGGAFISVYVVALIFLGVPLLSAEIALGRKYKKSAPQAFKSILPPAQNLGWASVSNSLLVAVFYSAIIGWLFATALNIFPLCQSAPLISQAEISNFFSRNIIKSGGKFMSYLSPVLVICTALGFVIIYFFLKGGAQTLSKISRFTVAIPVILLIFMAIRGLVYKNSLCALSALFVPNFSAYLNPELWLTALGQAFFSLSLLIGVMPAYGSFLPKNANIFKCSFAVALADVFVSVLSAIVLFTTAYGCNLQGEIIDSGFYTAFSLYPVAIAQVFPKNSVISGIFGVVFYVSVLLIALQSTLSLFEAFIVAIKDEFGVSQKRATIFTLLPCFVFSLIFCTNSGVLLVEIFDGALNGINVLVLGIAECVALKIWGGFNMLSAEINANTSRFKQSERFLRLSLGAFCPLTLIVVLVAISVKTLLQLNAVAPINAVVGVTLTLLVALSGLVVKIINRAR